MITHTTKLRIFNTNVKTVLFFGCKSWREKNTHKLQTFLNKSLRPQPEVDWIEKVTNKELWERTRQKCKAATLRGKRSCMTGSHITKNTGQRLQTSIELESLSRNTVEREKVYLRVSYCFRLVHYSNFSFTVSPARRCICKQITNWKSLILLICNLSSLPCKARYMI